MTLEEALDKLPDTIKADYFRLSLKREHLQAVLDGSELMREIRATDDRLVAIKADIQRMVNAAAQADAVPAEPEKKDD